MLKTYLIQIGNMNAQHNYKIKARSKKNAEAIAIKKHEELGRDMKDKKIYVIMSY